MSGSMIHPGYCAADAIQIGAARLQQQLPRVTPLALCKFVHDNSWHNYWEGGVRHDPHLRAKSLRLFAANGSYKKVLQETGDDINTTDPNQLWGMLIEGSLSKSRRRYMECGHRAIAVTALANRLNISSQHVTLYSRDRVTHHLVELVGDYGPELHDPDYGFCIRQDGKTMAARDIVRARRPAEYFAYSGNKQDHDFIDRLFDLGFFTAASVRCRGVDVLYVADRDADFIKWWRSNQADPSAHQTVVHE